MGLRVHEQRYFVVRCEHVIPPLNGGVVNRVSAVPEIPQSCFPSKLAQGFHIKSAKLTYKKLLLLHDSLCHKQLPECACSLKVIALGYA